ncbi:alpha/beta hydrolase [Hyphobacterium indicum]|uniref:alpha/beta hydrolase n=1 Tax=Hyphobacterium indicum TaxID=2162714 RepID=UPI000D64F14A|nr:alpha/beta hydrolase-fold protein [Hyphobacterium indicum]
MFARLLIVHIFLAVAAPAFANPIDAGNRTERFELDSSILGETREFLVRMPESYAREVQNEYPVLYVSDADWNFPLMAEWVEYLSHHGSIPELIVVGAVNVSRNRDFVPREDPNFAESGQGDRYLRHVAAEWIPEVESRYRVGEGRVFFGHSFGGVLVLNQLFTDPDLFDAYVALGSSTWVADRVLFERANAFFDAGRTMDAFLYMSVGETDGGATVPDGSLFAELLEARAPDSLDWSYRITQSTDHFTNVTASLHEIFMSLFPAWGFDRELAEAARTYGAAAAGELFDRRQSELGWRFAPYWFDVGVTAIDLARDGHGEAASVILEKMVEYDPDNTETRAFIAFAFAASGQTEPAIEAINEAIAHGIDSGHDLTRIDAFRNYRERLVGRLESE